MTDLITESTLREMTSGSLEEKLSMISEAIFDDSRLGKGTVVFATFEDKIIVANKSGTLSEVKYDSTKGGIRLGDISDMTGDASVSKVDIIESSNVKNAMMLKIKRCLGESIRPIEKAKKLSSDGVGDRLWTRYLDENRSSIVKNIASKYKFDYRSFNVTNPYVVIKRKLLESMKIRETLHSKCTNSEGKSDAMDAFVESVDDYIIALEGIIEAYRTGTIESSSLIGETIDNIVRPKSMDISIFFDAMSLAARSCNEALEE